MEVRTVILDGARAIMNERGFDGLTMRAVADRIEYSPAAIYKHFTDREELVRELCAHDFYAFNQALLARPGAGFDPRNPLESLRSIGRAYAQFAIQFPEQYRVMFMTPLPIEPDNKEAPGDDAYATLVAAVTAAHALGHFAGLDVHLVAQTLWASVHGVVSLEIAHLCVTERHIPFAPLADRVDAAVEGIVLGLEALARGGARACRPRSSARLLVARRVAEVVDRCAPCPVTIVSAAPLR